jgi:hypothetical protein
LARLRVWLRRRAKAAQMNGDCRCRKREPRSAHAATKPKENRRRPKLASSCAKKSSTYVQASMACAAANKPSPSACPRRGAPEWHYQRRKPEPPRRERARARPETTRAGAPHRSASHRRAEAARLLRLSSAKGALLPRAARWGKMRDPPRRAGVARSARPVPVRPRARRAPKFASPRHEKERAPARKAGGREPLQPGLCHGFVGARQRTRGCAAPTHTRFRAPRRPARGTQRKPSRAPPASRAVARRRSYHTSASAQPRCRSLKRR